MNETDHEFRQLTARQRQCLLFIVAHFRKHLRAPSMREIGEHMRIKSTNGVNDHLKALIRKGYVVRDPLLSRAVVPVGLRVVYEPPKEFQPHVFGEITKPSPKRHFRVQDEPPSEAETPAHLNL
jgi:SOS-response transcriptional repressor LexA